MTDTNDKKDLPSSPPPAVPWSSENRAGRWAKYSANVLLSCILVIGLAAIVVWTGQRFNKREDMTITSSYSLKPQTLAVIQNNTKPIKLVSLYARLKHDPSAPAQQDFAQPVADTLEEYHQLGKNIDVEIIDPVADPARLDAWVGEITRKYGGDVKGYRQLLQDFPQTLDPIKKLSSEQGQKMVQLVNSGAEFKSEKQAEPVNIAFSTVEGFPRLLQQIDEQVKDELQKKIPDYKSGVEAVRGVLDLFSGQVTKIKTALEQLRDDKTAPQAARDYAKDNIAKFDEMKKLADDELTKIKGLGELKLDVVRQKLSVDNENGNTAIHTIAVEGPNDIKLIDFKDAWTVSDAAGGAGNSNGPPQMRFAGERELTGAILSLTQPRKKVAFIRCGGPPYTTPNQERPPSMMWTVAAERLRADNFEVLEKDITAENGQPGHWAQQQAMQSQTPPPPDPTDDQIKDALWIVLDEQEIANTPYGQMPMPVPELAHKLSAHLARPLHYGSDLHVDSADARKVVESFDLRVDSADASQVRSSSHTFTAADVGRDIQINGPDEWKAGSYEISSVKGGGATLDRSPAPVGTTGGACYHDFTGDDVGQFIQIRGTDKWSAGSYKILSVSDGAAMLERSPAPTQTTGGYWTQGKQSALVLAGYHGGDLAETLQDWGVTLKPNFIAVHEKIGSGNDESTDSIEQARRVPPIFVFNEYGQSPVTTPLNSLDAAMVPVIPIETTKAADCKVMPILPLPTEPKSWGESNVDSLRTPQGPTYDPKDDLAPPIYGGALVEKTYKDGDTGRLIVIGCIGFGENDLLTIRDPQMEARHISVARFPGNGELLTNSVFWLAHRDRMIALSPAALDTPRIARISPYVLKFWRWGVLLAGLPLLAIIAGIVVWQKRQD